MARLGGNVDKIADSLPPLEVDDPSGEARVLVLGWGSTYGPIAAAVRAAVDASPDAMIESVSIRPVYTG